MSKRILIVTKPRDEHAHLVATGLEMMGVEPKIFRFGMMPFYQTHTIELGEKARIFVDEDVLLEGDAPFDRIWLRRVGPTSVSLVDVAPNDKAYVTKVMSVYRTSFFAFLEELAAQRPRSIVNGYWAKLSAESKMLQLLEARRAGLGVPGTIQSNDPDAIRAFQAKHGTIICKALVPQMWAGEERRAFCYTTILPPVDDIPREALRLHPAIYQPYVEKSFEARIIIFGGRQFGIQIDSQSDPSSVVDWRGKRLYKNNNKNYRLPKDVFASCLAMMQNMGIDYGAFDFIITPSGEHVFLEVNEAGQFIFVEDCAPDDRITHAFCHFLAHGNLDAWSNESATFTLKDLLTSERFKERRAADLGIRDFESQFKIAAYDEAVGALSRGA